MRAICFISLYILASVYLQPCIAQGPANDLCGSPQMRAKLIKAHPEILEQEKQFEAYTAQWIRNHPGPLEKSATGGIIIPLVFHIINQGGSENISDAQIADEVRILNRDYNKQNQDTDEAVADFKYIIADMGIEWHLATIDPNGNCTNGIDRITSDQTYYADDYSKLNTWPRENYVNVWVVASIANGAAGYAYFPADVQTVYSTPAMDGVLILSSYIGSIGTSSDLTSRALTHELGHVFNLQHPWGLTNHPEVSCGDDGVEDTPITMGWDHCPSPADAAICTPGVIENYQNYMDYSYCSVMFTEGQKARWLAAANSGVSNRTNLWSDSNLIATGVYDTVVPPCAPIAHFCASQRYVCEGSTIEMNNTSGNGEITSSLWHFPAGTTVGTSSTLVPESGDTSTSPVVAFHTPGWQTITLTVANSLGTSTLTDSLMVYVTSTTSGITAPYYEGFEDPNIFNENTWASLNHDENDTYDNNMTWFRQTAAAAHTGTGSAILNNYYAHANYDIDQIVTPAIDISHLSTSDLKFSFYYSFASANQYLSEIEDSMVVYVSDDCGVIWDPISNSEKLGSTSPNSVINAGYIQGPFVPGTATNFWTQVVCNIPPNYQTTHTRFMVQDFTTINGNNLYIDDVNIGNAPVATGTEQLSSINNISVYPNPTSGGALLSIHLSGAQNISVKVYDMSGKIVMDAFEGWMNNGANEVMIQGTNRLATGIYVVNVTGSDGVAQRKLIVQ